MKAVNTGNTFHIYDNSVKLYDSLPPKAYGIDFNPMQGFSLYLLQDIEVSERVYGVHETKVTKVLNSFKNFSRSLGVILSGDKGIGKSLFAKMLCKMANEEGYPVIICDNNYPDVARFIESIDQEAVVLFDEFDKTFKKSRNEDKADAQAPLLSLFDGVSMNKKLFCVTCNDMYSLNEYLINRPGRFHYHFRFNYPTKEEIETYMKDHLPADKFSEIEKVVNFSRKVNLNYDCLRSICYELTSCSTFEEAVADLNIIKPANESRVKFYVLFDDGSKFSENQHVDVFSDEEDEVTFGEGTDGQDDYLSIKFTPNDAVWSERHGGFFIPVNQIKVSELACVEDNDSWIMRNHPDFVRKHRAENVIGIVIKANFDRSPIHYFKAI